MRPVFHGRKSSSTTIEDKPTVAFNLREMRAKLVSDDVSMCSSRDAKPMMGVYVVNRMLRFTSNVAAAVFFVLLLLVYGLTPRENLDYLPDGERTIAAVATIVAGSSAISVLVVFYLVPEGSGKISGIVHAGLVVMTVSMIANGILAFAPTIVMIDPILKTRVFLVRWCEFIPLAGLMTFLCDIVGVPRSREALREASMYSICQSFSCTFGLIFPICPGPVTWGISLFFSILSFLPIFPRMYAKYKIYRDTSKGTSHSDMERYSRHRYSYELMLLCSILWSALVIVFFFNGYAHHRLPEGHALRPKSLNLFCEAAFDAVAKSFYMRQIVDSHKAVFQAEGLARRQLVELRRLMSVLWCTSSDTIVLSIRHDQRCLSLFSPRYKNLLTPTKDGCCSEPQHQVLVLELERYAESLIDAIHDDLDNTKELGLIKQAYYIDSRDLCLDTFHEATIDSYLDIDSFEAEIAQRIVYESWGFMRQSAKKRIPRDPLVFAFQRVDGSQCNCELNVMPHAANGMVTVMKDVSEPILRREAEKKAEAESLKRQRESQSQSRFVRHEVKNGLLAGIELVDNLRSDLDVMTRSHRDVTQPMVASVPFTSHHLKPDSPNSSRKRKLDHKSKLNENESDTAFGPWKRLRELDSNLRGVLDTVLAEAMARDVINEVYQPRIESIDVLQLLQKDRPNKERFPVRTKQNDFPILKTDPQLLRYIHRNAVSNACKYGEQGGMVLTLASFDFQTGELELQVLNSPGHGHDRLKALGSEANDAVFEQGKMLHQDLNINENLFISSGDGAWIAQKCARALGGSCSIRFECDHTFFSFRCQADAAIAKNKSDYIDFEVPAGTWAIAIDDSTIQRKVLSRIFDLIGISQEKKNVIGESPSDVFELEKMILRILETHPESKILVIVDENLDYGGKGEEVVILSGSRVMKDILTGLSRELEQRVFALVRSANDSSHDLATYLSRTHGFLPKVPMNKEKVRETLAPLWLERFHSK